MYALKKKKSKSKSKKKNLNITSATKVIPANV